MSTGEDALAQPPVLPAYQQVGLNAPIDFGNHAIELSVSGKAHRCAADVKLLFGRKADLRIALDTSDLDPSLVIQLSLDESWDGKVRFIDRGIDVDTFCIGGPGVQLVPRGSGFISTQTNKPLCKALAHLFNFPTFNDRVSGDYLLQTGSETAKGCRVCGRTRLVDNGWCIDVVETEHAASSEAELKKAGGYALTHVVEIKREDDTAFVADELQDTLRRLQHFLSFATGRWVGLAFPVAYDEEGDIAFEEWGTRVACPDHWVAGHSWFDVNHGELLGEVFPGFCTLASLPGWRERLHEVLWWYAAANERGPTITTDMAIVLAQAALELLAWLHCVEAKGMVSKDAFKPSGLRASDKLRLLATSLGVPKEIPQELDKFAAIKPKPFADAPHAISELRNATVHPDPKRALPDGIWYQGWRLSMWYLDLIFLALCGHNGKYANRLSKRWVGQLESVPWAKPS